LRFNVLSKPRYGWLCADVLYKVFYPAIWSLNQVASWVLRIIGLEPVARPSWDIQKKNFTFSPNLAVRIQTTLSRAIAVKAFSLKDLRARNIMLPRNKIVALFAVIPLNRT
jgi:CBS domain containing-hemolysin-like protein